MKILLERANNNLLELIVRAATEAELRTQCLNRTFAAAWELHYAKALAASEKPPLIPQDTAPPFLRCAVYILSDKEHHNKYKGVVKKYYEILAGHPYYNFYALKKLAEHCTKILSRDKENKTADPLILINKACEFAKTAAEHHPTLGYLLYAHVNYKMAEFFQHSNVALASAHTETAYMHLLIAQELEPHSCTDMNASSHWGFESIGAMKSAFQGFIKDSGLLIVTTRAEHLAAKKAKSIIELTYPEFEDGEDRTFLKLF